MSRFLISDPLCVAAKANNIDIFNDKILKFICEFSAHHCVKSVQIRSFPAFGLNTETEFGPNAGKYGPEKSLYLDTFHAVHVFK